MRKSTLAAKIAGALAVVALSGAFAAAQYGPPPGPQYAYPNAYPGQYDDQHWGRGPEGYGFYYHEQPGRPMLGARQGFVAGIAQGQSDRQLGHSFRPTHVDTYRHVPESPGNYPRGLFKEEYRDAFIHGYERGYGR